MLTKYTLVHVPERGVDRLLNGVRVLIDHTLTDEKADQLFALGCRYLQPVKQTPTPTADTSVENHGKESSQTKERRSAIAKAAKRSATGQFAKQ